MLPRLRLVGCPRLRTIFTYKLLFFLINLSYSILTSSFATWSLQVMKFNFGSHIRNLPVASISEVTPYSALILSIVLVVLFFIRFYILQRFLLEKLHGSIYAQMDEITRRSFINHYIAAATKLTILVIAIYPFGSVTFGSAYYHTPYVHESRVTMGDLLVIAVQIFTGMFIFELIYRVKISPVSVAHHIGSILVAQVAITISSEGAPESSIEFMLCTVWGKQVLITHR
jgi:hypothetical protein